MVHQRIREHVVNGTQHGLGRSGARTCCILLRALVVCKADGEQVANSMLALQRMWASKRP